MLKEVVDASKGIATFTITDDSELERSGYGAGEEITQSIFDGGCKAQWRADWALRWYALDVDYEMAGKDLVTAAQVAADIVKIMGGRGLPVSVTRCFWMKKAQKSPNPKAMA